MTMTPTGVDDRAVTPGDQEWLRYRATLRQILPLAVAFVGVCSFWWYQYLSWPRVGGPDATFEVIVFPAVFLGEIWLLGRWMGVTLTADAAVVRSLRRRTIPWDRIAAVQVEGFLTGQRIVLYETNGRRVPLRMPITAFANRDPRFSEKAQVIERWWLARRGPVPPGPWVEDAGAEVALPDRVRLRAPVHQWLLPAAALLPWGSNVVLATGFDDASNAAERAAGLLLAVAMLAGVALLYRRGALVLTAAGIRAGALRRRVLAWADITAISVERRRGGRRVVVCEVDGRRVALAAPRVGVLLWDSGFEVKVAMLDRWWAAHGGDAGRASAPPVPPYTGPRVWQRIVVGLLWFAVAYEVLVSLLLALVFVVLA